jgi:hypothetical protein
MGSPASEAQLAAEASRRVEVLVKQGFFVASE